jgi:hypothetical protein
MTVIVNAEPERGLGRPMIDKERRDLNPVRLVNNAFVNIGREDLDTLGSVLYLRIAPNVDIERERFLQMLEH